METLEAHLEIPIYSLEQSTTMGNRMFELIKANGQFRKHKANFLRPHRKDYYMLALVKEGDSKHWVDMVPYTLKPDTFYFSTPDQIHVKERSVPFYGTMLMFSKEFLAIGDNVSLKSLPIIHNIHGGHELQLSKEDLAFIEDLLDKMYAEYNNVKDYKSNMIQAYLRVLLIYVSRLYNEQFTQSDLLAERGVLKKYLSLIDKHFTELHEVSAYAKYLNISASHLSDVIKQQSGRSAIEHIHERLILEAKRLLFHTDCSVKEIAFQLGFEDASYFNRFFKRSTSTTPLAFRTTRNMYY